MKYQRKSKRKGKIILNLIFIFLFINLNAQSVINGTFTSGTANWGCSPETNPESTYGGTGSNRVAEVDASAGLCQTITGLTIGSIYQVTFVCSRRTNCGPPTQTLNFSINGGALAAQNVSRTGTFNFTLESFNFEAKLTSHTITFTGTSPGTCGLIIDNVSISLISALPIELLNFEANSSNNKTVNLFWQTATEINNDYFTIERSTNALEWEELKDIDGAGNSSSILSYSTIDKNPYAGLSYYRLKQTDFNGNYEYSKLKSINLINSEEIKIFPNPSENYFTITGNEFELSDVSIYNSLGQNITRLTIKNKISKNEYTIDLSTLNKGVYYLKTKTTANTIYNK